MNQTPASLISGRGGCLKMGVDWTELPPELIEKISETFTIYTDYLHFQAVCRTWKSSIPKTPAHLPPQLPWLMLPQGGSNQSSNCAFFNLSDEKFHFLKVPEASHHKRFCGSSHGWLVILEDSPSIHLLNPLTRAKACLPPLSSFPNVVSFNYSDIGREYVLADAQGHRYTASLRQMRDRFIKKVVLSSSPLKNRSNFMAMGIYAGDLVYSRDGDELWKIVENAHSFCEEVIFFKGVFYAVDKVGKIAVCDVSGDSPKVSFIETPPQTGGGDMQYLVGFGDELLLVTRFLDLDFEVEHGRQLPFIYRTEGFEVFKLDWSGPRWEGARSLGDMMLFIGENSSLALLASGFSGCTGNCIYYTDDYSATNYDGRFGEYDLGIYKLSDGSIEPLPCYTQNCCSLLQWPSPLWISPNP